MELSLSLDAEAILRIGQTLRVPVLPVAAPPSVAAVPIPPVQSPQIAAAPDPTAAAPDQDPTVVQELTAPETGAPAPPVAPSTPAAPAPNPLVAGPHLKNIIQIFTIDVIENQIALID